MYDYDSFDKTPWAQYQEQIISIQKDSRSQYTSIGKNAFFGCKNIEYVELPNTFTYIKNRAFNDCVAMTSIKFGSSLKNIERRLSIVAPV